MINSIRSERGWRGGRRIAVLVSVLTVFGIAYFGSAGSASATFAQCGGTVSPQNKANPGQAASISFTCTHEIRAYGVVSSKPVEDYATVPRIGGVISPFFECEGNVPAGGFGCGVKNRAIAKNGTGTQVPPSTGSTTSCGRSTAVLPVQPASEGGAPAVNKITGPNCAQVVSPGTVVTQLVTLGSNPCMINPAEPLRMFVIAGGEPAVTSFTVRGDSVGVGEYTTEPYLLKQKGYGKCKADAAAKVDDDAKANDKGAKAAASTKDVFPVSCAGQVIPKDLAKPGIDMKYEFACNANIKGYSITSNKKLDFFGFESEVYLPIGAISGTESALIQCEGPVPGFGVGCGITNRQSATGQLTAHNKLVAELGVPVSPCKRETGESKLKFWLTVMGEPAVPSSTGGSATTGEYVSEPFRLPLIGYSSAQCPRPENGASGKK